MLDVEYSRAAAAVKKLLETKTRVIVAVDGPSCSGKTTLAARLGEEFSAQLFHMDDFFLRPEQRTPQRYAEPGGNVDRERFLEQVLLPIRRGDAAVYSRFDCGSMSLGPKVRVSPARVNIVEGSYSLHPELREHYDLRIMLRVEPEVQLARLETREGEGLESFVERWLPLERQYHEHCAPEACAELLLQG